MEEKDINKEIVQDSNKLDWEAPKLFCLDKGKTEGGGNEGFVEGTEYSGSMPS